jgi:hypothetical protein
LVVFPNHLLPVFGLSACIKLLRQLVLACLQFSFPLLPCASRHLVFLYAVHVREEALQVSYPALERIGAASVLVIVGEVRSPVVLGLLVVLARLEGAVFLECLGRGRCIARGLVVLALLRHVVVLL